MNSASRYSGLALDVPAPELKVTTFGGGSDAVTLPLLSYDIDPGIQKLLDELSRTNTSS